MKTGLTIKNIYRNLIFTTDDRVYAYYRLREWNNSFITERQKEVRAEGMERLFESTNVLDIHMIQVSVENSLVSIQRKRLEDVKGQLQEFSKSLIEEQGEYLEEEYGGSRVDSNHYIGFRLQLPKRVWSMESLLAGIKESLSAFSSSFAYEMLGEYYMIPKETMDEYLRMEKLMYQRFARMVSLDRVTSKDYGYLIEHLLGLEGVSYEDYCYQMKQRELDGNFYSRQVDIKRLNSVALLERGRYIQVDRKEGRSYMTFLALATVVEDLTFPSCEVLYYQKLDVSFPVDVSIRAEVVGYKKAIKELEDKKKELKDQEDNALKTGNDVEEDVYIAMQESDSLKEELKHKRTSMFRVNLLVRVSARSKEELESRCLEVIDFYDSYDMKLVRSFGDNRPFLEESLPCGKMTRRDYTQPTRADFLSSLGFGGTTRLGDEYGIYIGRNVVSGKPVYIRPDLAAKKESQGSVTNSMSVSFTGATGWGKSMSSNLILAWIGISLGRVLIIDPKNERSSWMEYFPELRSQVNLINIETDEGNRGMLDPFLLLKDSGKAETVALNVLCFLSGVKASNKTEFAILQREIKRVSLEKGAGLLKVIVGLKEQEEEEAKAIAGILQAFSEVGVAKLLFSDGVRLSREMTVDKAINILQVADLNLPDSSMREEEYTPENILSLACMQVIGAFGMEFLSSDTDTFKVLGADESWSLFGGRSAVSLDKKAVRMGRSLNSGIYFMSQGIEDIGDKNIRNNIGMRFAFHTEDEEEIEKVLSYFGLDSKDESLKKVLRGLRMGEALMRDIWGHIGIVKFEMVFEEFFEMFDTSTDRKKG